MDLFLGDQFLKCPAGCFFKLAADVTFAVMEDVCHIFQRKRRRMLVYILEKQRNLRFSLLCAGMPVRYEEAGFYSLQKRYGICGEIMVNVPSVKS